MLDEGACDGLCAYLEQPFLLRSLVTFVVVLLVAAGFKYLTRAAKPGADPTPWSEWLALGGPILSLNAVPLVWHAVLWRRASMGDGDIVTLIDPPWGAIELAWIALFYILMAALFVAADLTQRKPDMLSDRQRVWARCWGPLILGGSVYGLFTLITTERLLRAAERVGGGG